MRRRVLIALLVMGTIGGYASGIAGMCCRGHHRRAMFERHIAKICADAARSPGPAPSDDYP